MCGGGELIGKIVLPFPSGKGVLQGEWLLAFAEEVSNCSKSS